MGELGVVGPQRGGRGAFVDVFSGQATLGGFVGILQQIQQINNSEDNLNLQTRTLKQLTSLLNAGLIDLVQVDQFRQNVVREESSLLQSRVGLELSKDNYKTRTLGLPPDVPIELELDLIRQFQLVDRAATSIQDQIVSLQDELGDMPEVPQVSEIRRVQDAAIDLVKQIREHLDLVHHDLTAMKHKAPLRLGSIENEHDKQEFVKELGQLDKAWADVAMQFAKVEQSSSEIKSKPIELPDPELPAKDAMETQPPEAPKADQDANPNNDDQEPAPNAAEQDAEGSEDGSDDFYDSLMEIGLEHHRKGPLRDTVVLLREMIRVVQGAILVQARSRLEVVMIDPIELPFEVAFRIALANRLDFMNGRSAVVDSWRQIQIAGDALQSVLNVTARGDVRTARNNPVAFNAKTSTLALGVQFDAPLTRLIERNNYRESLINYQRSRRTFIQSRDQLHQGLRVLLRQIEFLKANLELQRKSVAIAIRRVDVTRAALYAPVAPPEPGQRAAPFGPTAAINLLSAQTALRDSQNAFLSVWLNYYANKMRLARELGIMTLNRSGRWNQGAFENAHRTWHSPTRTHPPGAKPCGYRGDQFACWQRRERLRANPAFTPHFTQRSSGA